MSILHSFEEHILTVEIARAQKRNTLDAAMLESLTELLRHAHNDTDVRVVFLHAQPHLFCAGGDLSEQLSAPSCAPEAPATRMIEALAACSKPIVACVEGPAVGLAVTMLCYCDLVYASTHSLFSLPFTALGLTPRYGASLLTLLQAGYHKAAEKLLLSEPITAQEALQMGLVSSVFDDDAVRAQALARVQRLAKMSPVAIQETKALLRAADAERLAATRALEARTFAQVSTSDAAKEACAAFLEGRMPKL